MLQQAELVESLRKELESEKHVAEQVLSPKRVLWPVLMTLWRCGLMALWPYSAVALWRCGLMALWPYGPVALWPCGLMALWPRAWGQWSITLGPRAWDCGPRMASSYLSNFSPWPLAIYPTIAYGL